MEDLVDERCNALMRILSISAIVNKKMEGGRTCSLK